MGSLPLCSALRSAVPRLAALRILMMRKQSMYCTWKESYQQSLGLEVRSSQQLAPKATASGHADLALLYSRVAVAVALSASSVTFVDQVRRSFAGRNGKLPGVCKTCSRCKERSSGQ